ncbi:type IV toxin-antitoxin system AbiEi family antitoxin [Halalkalibaculum sp. DA3122]|uniref:type IV toxin-antitoxin system AbiEi family antitoxin domain-containing protein n=1 Tax=Halalkalibaculum sp. DA3122 TaxID=3373607 RepID=UPI003754CF17
MGNTNTYEYLGSYLDRLRSQGRYTFTGDEVRSEFSLNDEAYQKVIQRLLDKDRIARLRQNFYLIIPPEYAVRQTLPLGYFVDDLMQFLDRKYYVGLLTAAMYHGAAHQQPQQQFVIAEPPYLRPIKNQRQSILFCMKKEWDVADVEQQKTDAGFINISNPSLTALDLVFYVDRIGGFNRTATVLSELASEINVDKLTRTAQRFKQTTILQRLGYLLDRVLHKIDLSDALYEALDQRNFYPTPLNPGTETENKQAPNIWKVIPNIDVEAEL